MGATPEDRNQLDILDRLAVLSDIDGTLRDVITRLANRAKTDDEGDDVKLLILCRGRIADYHDLVAQCHRNGRNGRNGSTTQPIARDPKHEKGI